MSTKKQTVLGMVVVAALMLFVPVLSIAGSLDPSAAPAPTMKTLDQIPPTWSQTLQCDTTACPRFQLVLDGAAVLDKETGLVWEQSPSKISNTWVNAMYICRNKVVGNRKGWRPPTVEELESLVDPTRSNPALSAGHPFTNVLTTSYYWSATTNAADTTYAWAVYLIDGGVNTGIKTTGLPMWCVRGGQGYDGQ